MAQITVTNQVSSQALRGQNIKITLNGDDATNQLPQLYVGLECIDDSSSDVLGLIYSVDSYGNSFEVQPLQPDFSASIPSLPGYYYSGRDVIVNIP